MTDLSPIVLPVVVSVILSLTGAFVVARYSGPAQSAYIAALEGRLRVIAGERDDGMARMSKLEIRIVHLEAEVAALKAANDEKDREIAALYRRLDDSERRMDIPKRRPT
jgi:hypothetical protein